MNLRRSTLATIAALACTAAFTLAGCGGGGGNSLAQFCKDYDTFNTRYASMNDLTVFDPGAVEQVKSSAVDLKKLAAEAPAAIKGDVTSLSDDMQKVVAGQGDSVDDNASQAVGDRVDAFASSKCDGADTAKKSSAPQTTTTVEPTTIDPTADPTIDPGGDSTFATTPVDESTTLPSSTMPDIVNSTVADAETALTSAGITNTPVIVEKKDATVAPGLVVEQDPSSGSDVTADDTVTFTVSALPDQAYLSDLRASDGQFRTGVATMKGVPYTHGVLQSQGNGYNPQKTTFTLSSHYTRLKGVVGLDDSFTGGATVQVEIFDQDNTSLFKKTVKVGAPLTIDIPVTGVIQLSVEATDLLTGVANSGTVVWGDLEVISGS